MTSDDFAAFRMRLGVSQAVLGRLVGLSTKQVANIEKGRSAPTLQTSMLCTMLAETRAFDRPAWASLVFEASGFLRERGQTAPLSHAPR